MRLSQIKIAGFKSFVDPTKLVFPKNLTGIVGPNGCGKSNVIDAVRWVMGESSAKHLRGDSMEDVIFGGSSTRKPVGQASVELMFDNSDGKISGEYAQYNEISIKRQVTRAGQSKYFLNNTKCRRRDIADIFLGTGLGPRSYAIIEQGMVSRIIDSKPEDLRVYFEEAAGISKYKERRRETENRIRHTRENLDRLTDLREEIDKQLSRLNRQSKSAEKYKRLKQEQRRLQAESLLLQKIEHQTELEKQQAKLEQLKTALQAAIAALRNIESRFEQGREAHHQATESFNQIQASFYQLGSDISKTEQEISSQLKQQEFNQAELEKLEFSQQESTQLLQQDETRQLDLQSQVAEAEPQRHQLTSELEQHQQTLQTVEQEMQNWQEQWDSFNRDYHSSFHSAQMENRGIEHIENQLTQLEERQQKLQFELQGLNASEQSQQINQLKLQIDERETELKLNEQRLLTHSDNINQFRHTINSQASDLDNRRNQVQQKRGRLASLEALQQNSFAASTQELDHWLQQQQISDARRLAELIEVETGYEKAVEAALAPWLGAICVSDSTSILGQMPADQEIKILDFGKSVEPGLPGSAWVRLLDKISCDIDLTPLLAEVYLCENQTELAQKRSLLTAQQSLVSRDGICCGHNWLLQIGEEDEGSGLIVREQEIKQIRSDLERETEQALNLKAENEARQQQLHELEIERDKNQQHYNHQQRDVSELASKLGRFQQRAEQMQQRQQSIQTDLSEIEKQQSELKSSLQSVTVKRNDLLEQINQMENQKESRQQHKMQLMDKLSHARQAENAGKDRLFKNQMNLQSLESELKSIQSNLQRIRQMQQHNAQRETELKQFLLDQQQPLVDLQQNLQAQLTRKSASEQELQQVQQKVSELDLQQRDLESQRNQLQQKIDVSRSDVSAQQMVCQEFEIHIKTILEQLADTEFDLMQLQQEMSEQAELKQWQQQLHQLTQKIDRLGPINLAAIEEYQEQLERKEYLDAQNEDLNDALETLEKAIRKIDKETKHRFKETFDQVNQKFSQRFPKLFGGGEAHLELTEDDLLSTGVMIMARPPGKRINNLQLLSGGEKALTAVALIFAIFELNPSPFCMLDEVDAPLDDANVGRYCAMVEEMSETVQFIFITHNKISMESAQTLNGVTMHEPGVSRLVSVNIDEAAKMVVES